MGISELISEFEEIEKNRIEKLKQMKANKNAIEYFEDHGDGGFWKPLTDEVAEKMLNKSCKLEDFRINLYYLVKSSEGICILSEEDFRTYKGQAYPLYQGSFQACKDFIKV